MVAVARRIAVILHRVMGRLSAFQFEGSDALASKPVARLIAGRVPQVWISDDVVLSGQSALITVKRTPMRLAHRDCTPITACWQPAR
jgi:hypothetical protein